MIILSSCSHHNCLLHINDVITHIINTKSYLRPDNYCNYALMIYLLSVYNAEMMFPGLYTLMLNRTHPILKIIIHCLLFHCIVDSHLRTGRCCWNFNAVCISKKVSSHYRMHNHKQQYYK